MNHIFCTECGNKIEYTYSKPNFCPKCGNRCGGLSNSRDNSVRKFQVEHDADFDEGLAEDETNSDHIPDINRLAVETESYGNNVFTFGSLVGEEGDSPRVRNKGSRSIDDFIDDKRGR